MKKVLLTVLIMFVTIGTCFAESSGTKVVSAMQDKIRLGVAYNVVLSDTALADDASISTILTVSTSNARMTVEASCVGGAELFIYENPTVTDIGTDFTPVNYNRVCSLTSDITVSTGPTISDYGTTVYSTVFVNNKETKEIVLDAEDQYMIRVENESAAASAVSLVVNFYEEGA